jgi:hypothetical protein
MLKFNEDPEVRAVIDTYVKAIGDKIPRSLADLIHVETENDGFQVMVPYWFPIVEYGRGPRKNTEDHKLVERIYKWMAARNMFKSETDKGKQNEARQMTWYINHYGTSQFRKKIYRDIYNTETDLAKRMIEEKFRAKLVEVARGLVKLE